MLLNALLVSSYPSSTNVKTAIHVGDYAISYNTTTQGLIFSSYGGVIQNDSMIEMRHPPTGSFYPPIGLNVLNNGGEANLNFGPSSNVVYAKIFSNCNYATTYPKGALVLDTSNSPSGGIYFKTKNSPADLYLLPDGFVYIYTLTTGIVSSDATGLLSNSPSDTRLKTNVKPLTNVLDRVKKLNGVRYKWNTKINRVKDHGEQTEIGLIAQEVEKIFPSLVFTDATNYKCLHYDKLAVILLEAIKELAGDK
jgi:hypothetical protein